MRLTERQLRKIIRAELLNEVGGSDYVDDRTLSALSDPAARKAMGSVLKAAGEAGIDFGKSLTSLLADTFLYFKTGQQYIDAVKGLTGKDVTPKSQEEWRAQIAAAGLHEFLDKFGSGGLDAADVINGFLYMGEKNWKMAGLCMVAAIPAVGSALVVSKGTGRFTIKATEKAALDTGITEIKQGLKASGASGADEVVKEIDKIRVDMNGAKADFKPYEQIPSAQSQAVKEVASNPSRLKKAYDDIKELAKINATTYPEGHPQRYAVRSGVRTDASNRAERWDFPQGYGGIVPSSLTPGTHTAGKDILKAWAANADKQFFRNEVRTVHWLGFSRHEQNRTAAQALDEFLDDAALSKNVQISTIGYTQKINPGPRAGVSFREGLESRQVQVGIKLRGDVVYATTEDAWTTNRPGVTKYQLQAAREGSGTPPTFEKVPRPSFARPSDLATFDPSHPLHDPELRAEYLKDLEAAKAMALKNFDPKGDPWSSPKVYEYMPDKWSHLGTTNVIPRPAGAGGAESFLMLDKSSWREPFTDKPSYNEVVLDDWLPEAIYLNPMSATKTQIAQIKAVADKHGLKLLDLGGGEIRMSDFEPRGAQGFPLRQAIKDDSTAAELGYEDVKGKTVYTGVKYPVNETQLRRIIRENLSAAINRKVVETR